MGGYALLKLPLLAADCFYFPQIINAFQRVLAARAQELDLSVYFFDSHFVANLFLNPDFSHRDIRTGNLNIATANWMVCERSILPVHVEGNHWLLVVIRWVQAHRHTHRHTYSIHLSHFDTNTNIYINHHTLFLFRRREGKIEAFDSGNTTEARMEMIFDRIILMLREDAIERTGCTLGELMDGRGWTKSIIPCTKQANNTDCGVFTCVNMFCELFGLNKDLVKQDRADCFRRKIGVCVLNGTIC